MILPIRAIGDPILKRKAAQVQQDYPNLQVLIDNMFETMYNAKGIGLAAPQVGESLRMFIIDTGVSVDEEDDEKSIREIFINPEIEVFFGQDVGFEEGCLSIPHIREEVIRPDGVKIWYYDRHFKKKSMEMDKLLSRVFQHEYDHIEGILFTDLISSLKKGLLKGKLEKISRGRVKVDYPMRFPKK